MRLRILLILLSGAAFAQGAVRPPPPPRPPSYSPTTAVPVAPGYGVHPDPPPTNRGTHTRVLPPTREPGIWASDGPKGEVVLPAPVVEGITLPYPPEAETAAQRPVDMCADLVRSTLPAVDPAQSLRGLDVTRRRCEVARLYYACALMFVHADNLSRKHSEDVDAAREQRHKVMRGAAEQFMEESCKGIRQNPGTMEPGGLMKRMVQAWADTLAKP